MASLRTAFKSYKPLHWLYNLFRYNRLLHNKKAFKDYHVHKPLFTSISSKDFPDKTSQAWLDLGNSAELCPQAPGFSQFSTEVQKQILEWSANGYMKLNQYFTDDQTDKINAEIDIIVQKNLISPTHDNKLPFAHKISAPISQMTQDKGLVALLQFLLQKEVIPFQTLNFLKGSSQRAHSDSIHMTTYPLGYLIAVWVALEDTNLNNGPLFYYPASHRLPFLLNNDFNEVSSFLQLGKKTYADYEDAIADVIEKHHLKKEVFLARKGDVFIWHANLLHGGSPIIDHSLTRKSMVIHYYAKDVVKYHEITERPSLI